MRWACEYSTSVRLTVRRNCSASAYLEYKNELIVALGDKQDQEALSLLEDRDVGLLNQARTLLECAKASVSADPDGDAPVCVCRGGEPEKSGRLAAAATRLSFLEERHVDPKRV